MTAWYDSSLKLFTHSSVTINDLFAGVDVEEGSLSYTSLPNHAPEACGFGAFETRSVSPQIDWVQGMGDFYDSHINAYCIHGHYGCWGKEDDLATYTNVGDYDKKQSCEFKKTKHMRKPDKMSVVSEQQLYSQMSLSRLQEKFEDINVGVQMFMVTLLLALFFVYIRWMQSHKAKEFEYVPIQ